MRSCLALCAAALLPSAAGVSFVKPRERPAQRQVFPDPAESYADEAMQRAAFWQRGVTPRVTEDQNDRARQLHRVKPALHARRVRELQRLRREEFGFQKVGQDFNLHRTGSKGIGDKRDDRGSMMIFRLPFSGSSWFTQMLSRQNDTYICRECLMSYRFPKRLARIKKLGTRGVGNYLLRALSRPMGSIQNPSDIQTYDYTEMEGVMLASVPSYKQQMINKQVLKCLDALGHDCPVKHVGLTLDPDSTGLNGEVLDRVKQTYPNLPVIVYRRSNIVKHALASGGMAASEDGEGDANRLDGQRLEWSEFLEKLRWSQGRDKALRRMQQLFPNAMVVTYEELQQRPVELMNEVFEYLGIPGSIDPELIDTGEKHTSDDLSTVLENYEDLLTTLREQSPCLAEQFASPSVEVFPDPCPDI